jgi:hypothetical protein
MGRTYDCGSLEHGAAGEGGFDMVSILAAITSLVSVITAGLVAVFSLRQTRSESRSQRSQQYLISILPRRLDALENTWRMVFDLEAGESLTSTRISQLVQYSIWLPESIRDQLIGLFSHPDQITNDQVSRVRNELLLSSGAQQIDILRANLVEVHAT